MKWYVGLGPSGGWSGKTGLESKFWEMIPVSNSREVETKDKHQGWLELSPAESSSNGVQQAWELLHLKSDGAGLVTHQVCANQLLSSPGGNTVNSLTPQSAPVQVLWAPLARESHQVKNCRSFQLRVGLEYTNMANAKRMWRTSKDLSMSR